MIVYDKLTIRTFYKHNMKKSSKINKLLVQIAKYAVSGGAWFWSGYIIIVILDNYVGLFWANAIGNAVGITINYILNRFWVFNGSKNDKKGRKTTWRYIIYTIINSFLLNYLILYALKNIGIQPEIGQFIAAAFFTVWNFIWYKMWVFKDIKVSKGGK